MNNRHFEEATGKIKEVWDQSPPNVAKIHQDEENSEVVKRLLHKKSQGIQIEGATT
jgi:hypothetical protein